MRILYLSCHSILEHNEILLFHQMGHKVFSPGAYVCPANPGDHTLRPGIPDLIYDPDILAQFHRIAGSCPGSDAKDYLTKEFIDNFDVVIVMHMPRWVTRNWEAIKHKRVIWRTIGQSVASTEAQLLPYRQAGMQIVRYSPKERNIPGYIGEDGIIRFYKDSRVYGPWIGSNKRVISLAQHMKQRDSACNYTFFEEVTRPFPRHLFGPGNEGQDWTTGKIPFDQLIQELKLNRVYFYTGTHPASYTLNFIEAWLSGIPVVAIGPAHGNASYFPGHDLYEVPELIKNYTTGFVSDDIRELRSHIKLLLDNDIVAKTIGVQGRQAAERIFGKDTICFQWKRFLAGDGQ